MGRNQGAITARKFRFRDLPVGRGFEALGAIEPITLKACPRFITLLPGLSGLAAALKIDGGRIDHDLISGKIDGL